MNAMTLREACTLVVGMLGDDATARNVHRFLADDGYLSPRGAAPSPESVRTTLVWLSGATVEITVPGSNMGAGRYRPSEAARAWLTGECGESRCAA
jgi:hypothetical protein